MTVSFSRPRHREIIGLNRRPASDDGNERTLEFSSGMAVAGKMLLEAAGKLQLLYEMELQPDSFDIDDIRRGCLMASESLRDYERDLIRLASAVKR